MHKWTKKNKQNPHSFFNNFLEKKILKQKNSSVFSSIKLKHYRNDWLNALPNFLYCEVQNY